MSFAKPHQNKETPERFFGKPPIIHSVKVEASEPKEHDDYWDQVAQINQSEVNPAQAPQVVDHRRRLFLSLVGAAGLSVLVGALLPKKASALVLGSTPGTSVVGVKDATETRISPATEATLLKILDGQGVKKITTTLAASGNVLTPASGKKLRVYSTRFSLTADAASVAFRFTAGGTNYESYSSPKTGGLYGANNHPNYVEGGVDQVLYCVISGTTSVQINVDYIEI